MSDETDRAKKSQLEKKRIVSRQHAEDAYERPGDLYRAIADAGGLGWLHLPSEELFNEMQDRKADRMKMETLEIECPTCHSEIVLTAYDNDQCSQCGKEFWGRYEDLFVKRPK